MPCGHMCPQACHPDDRGHLAVMCSEPCMRLRPILECPEQHPCPKICGQPCGLCLVTLRHKTLDCGHVAASIPCHHFYLKTFKCPKLVQVLPPCGHAGLVPCHVAKIMETRPEEYKCDAMVSARAPCGHTTNVHCWETAQLGADHCRSPCGEDLPCGHQCGKKCGHDDGPHACTVECGRSLHCFHVCRAKCHGDDCPPCAEPCLLTCRHANNCPKKCSEDCAPCMQPCTAQCEHLEACPVPCGAPCLRLPCNERCTKLMACGHPCVSLCGEVCPGVEACRACSDNHPERLDQVVDVIMGTTLREHDPAVSPLLQLTCKHVW
jgi:hypothetical protein